MSLTMAQREALGRGFSSPGPIYVEKSDGTFVAIADADGNVDAPVTTTDLTTTGNTTLGNAVTDTTAINGATTITSTSASALTVGANGATNPALKIAASAASVATGVSVTGAAAGSAVTVAAISSGTNESLILSGKGTGAVRLGQATSSDVRLEADQPIADSSGNEYLKFSKAGTAVNEFTVANAAAGSGVSLSATGGDTNISATFAAKGTGPVILGQATSSDVRLIADQPIADSSGNEYIKFSKATTAVNEVTVSNSATGNPVGLSATGTDANVSIVVGGKGSGITKLGSATTQTATATAGAATSDAQMCVITSEGLTTAANATYTLTLTNNKVDTSSGVFVTLAWGTNSQGRPVVEDVTPGTGSVVIVVRNYDAAAALNGTLIFNVLVL